MPAAIDLIGRKFGRLTAIASAHVVLTSGRQMPAWRCRCDCGNEAVVQGHHLRGGKTTSCGCYRQETSGQSQRTHGASRTQGYNAWQAMINRCHRAEVENYHWYGARGITVCDRWRFGEAGVSGYDCFCADMGPRPPGYTIERVDNNGNYEPSNCRWASRKEQMLNQRPRGTATPHAGA